MTNEPRTIRMTVVPKPDGKTGLATIFHPPGEGTLLVEDARGPDITQACGQCGAPILHGMAVDFENVAFRCSACDAYNVMVPLDVQNAGQ